MRKIKTLLLAALTIMTCSCVSQLERDFKTPPRQYKPMPFWHINGKLTTEIIRQQMKDANDAGFTGVSFLPLASRGEGHPGTTPRFLSEEYFARYQDLLDVAQELDMEVILYDDNDFPSGMAGGIMQEKYPDLTMKRLDKIEHHLTGPTLFTDTIPGVQLMSAVAINRATQERIELSAFVKDMVIRWQAPEGDWTLMLFPLMKDSFHQAYLCMDFMDTLSVRSMINETYEKYKARFGGYFGNTIKTTFFDDVGFWEHPRCWTPLFNDKFEELHHYDPRPYYPALWGDIGPETEAVRNAFFHTRAELLAEGFPKLVAQWNEAHGLNSTGHPPGNYDPTPVDMNGDIFKFFRYTQIPLTDAILDYQFGQNGHKLISSAADYYDRPLVATEIYGAYSEEIFDSLMLYRSMMDLFVRGVNMVIPHGMWYDPTKVYIAPLVSPYSEKIAAALPAYSDYVGRTSRMLRGGDRVSEIGLIYPFEGMAGYFRFDNPGKIRQGYYIAPETDYQTVSGWLTNDIRRDFTFIHPELFLDEKYRIAEGTVTLDNPNHQQQYHTMLLTGSKVITLATLQKLKEYYDNGGIIIATTMLPYKSASRGNDDKVIALTKEIFGVDPLQQSELSTKTEQHNSLGGKAIFIPRPTAKSLEECLEQHSPTADLYFTAPPTLKSDLGKFNYIHKIYEGRHIYLFTNSSDQAIATDVLLRGKLKPEQWDPHTGKIKKDITFTYEERGGTTYTRITLRLPAVRSTFIVATQ